MRQGLSGYRLAGLLIALAVVAPRLARAEPGFSVTPRPAAVALTGASLNLPPSLVISVPPRDRGARAAAVYLRAELEARLHRPVRIGPGGGLRLARSADPQPVEGYRLEAGGAAVQITATGDAGLFYGAVTLAQMVETAPDGSAKIAAGRITDAPRFPWRGVMLDSARHYQSVAWIRRFIDEIARHKLNVLHWRLSDDQAWRLEIRRYPRLARIGGWRVEAGETKRSGGVYTRAQVRSLVAWAASRHVTLVPEIDLPGHATAALAAYPAWAAGPAPAAPASGWGVYPNLFNPREATMRALEAILDEVTDLFPSPVIHLGGDEVVKDAWVRSPEVQARIRALGLADETALQAWMMRRLAAHLALRGRRMIGWDEVLAGGPPPGAVVMSWHGTSPGLAAARSGHDAVMSPVLPLYFDYRQADGEGEGPGRGVFPLRLVYDFEPLPPGADPAVASRVLGLQANIWTEFLRSEARVEFAAFPRMAAVAEAAWTPPARRDWGDFLDRLPAVLDGYRRRGVRAADSALRIRAQADPAGPGRARITLSRQYPLGEVRYTLDGAAPDAGSPAYVQPVETPLPVRLRAAAVRDGRPLPGALDVVLGADAATDWRNARLALCSSRLAASLESLGGSVVRVDVQNPCWLTPAASLDGVSGLSLRLTALPFNFEIPERDRTIALDPAAGPGGLMEVRLDGCEGPAAATATLPDPASATSAVVNLALPETEGPRRLCLQLRRARPGPFWAVEQAALTRPPEPAPDAKPPPNP